MSKKVLYEVYEYTCDLCGNVWQPDYWADNANGGICNIAEDGLNGTDRFKWEHLCRECRLQIQEAVAGVVVRRRPQTRVLKCACGHDSSQHTKSGPERGYCNASDSLGRGICPCHEFRE